ncbi:hypothetical protein BGV67_04500 [Burkholderia ubonensis]|uniref:hypothetical protein n=1 Tax=Burkholderia ubonensis TaxID=101571 RepID=UPI0009000D75|nr:hypothetical protein [Burkholderia ubonensis]OJA74943.1 hypothetical protein BGV67_04500 [Burkholderia ubonensis]
MTLEQDDDAAFTAELDANVAALMDELRQLPYDDLLQHAAVATAGVSQLQSLLDSTQALLREVTEAFASSTDLPIGAAQHLADFAATAQEGQKRLKKNAIELVKAAYAEGRKKTARAGGAAKNAENVAMKVDVFRWLDRHLSEFKTLDDAADAILQAKLVPVGWRTIRSYITEYKKLERLRSASRL